MWRYLVVLLVLESACASPISPCVKLSYRLMQETTKLIKDATTMFTKILQETIDDMELDLSESDKQLWESFGKIVQHSKQMDNSDDIFIVFDVLEEIFDLFESDEFGMDSLSSEEHDTSNPFIEHFDNLIKDALQRIETHLESYFKLMQDEKLLDFEYDKWLTTFKSETDAEKKFDMIEEFMHTIDCKLFYISVLK